MTQVYLLPEAESANDEVQQMCSAAQVPFFAVEKIYQLLKAVEANGMVVIRIAPSLQNVIDTIPDQLWEALPMAVVRAPSSVYSTNWNTIFHAYPVMDWRELQNQLAKTGLLSKTGDEVLRTKHDDGGLAAVTQASAASARREKQQQGPRSAIPSIDESVEQNAQGI